MTSSLKRAAVAAALFAAVSCGRSPAPAKTTSPASETAPVVQPGSPGDPSRNVAATPATAPATTTADVRFMQGMILHHTQALAMVDLLKTRTKRDDMQLFAKKIEVSQTDEIKMMRTWLIDRHQPAPSKSAGGHDQLMMISGEPMAPMPGMLTEQQMNALAAASGPAFDKLFLAGMIQHHQGALQMVADLFAVPDAAQDSIIFDFASHVDSDQRMDISRMRQMLSK